MRLALVLSLIALQACYKRGQALQPPVRAGSPAAAQQSQPRLARKTVSAREAPNKLFSHDGTSCIVPESQFREVIVGTSATCLWSKN